MSTEDHYSLINHSLSSNPFISTPPSIHAMSPGALPPDIPSDVANRRLFAWVSTTIVLSLAILSYVLRIWARKKSAQSLKWDDWLMGIGLLISTEPAICEYLCRWIPLQPGRENSPDEPSYSDGKWIRSPHLECT